MIKNYVFESDGGTIETNHNVVDYFFRRNILQEIALDRGQSHALLKNRSKIIRLATAGLKKIKNRIENWSVRKISYSRIECNIVINNNCVQSYMD